MFTKNPLLKFSGLEEKKSLELGPGKPFLDFDLELTEEEKSNLNSICITSPTQENPTVSYENYGQLETLFSDVKHFISSLSPANLNFADSIAKVVTKLTQKVCAQLEGETAWVCVRASIPTKEFTIPRWHLDGYYYKPYIDNQYKAAVALKGPRTLFFNASNEQRKALSDYQLSIQTDEKGEIDKDKMIVLANNQKMFLNNIFNKSMAITADSGQGTIFLAGDNGAIHSEPDIASQSLFVSILPGSRVQIEELADRWNITMKSFTK
jgi:hypothetical protein